MGNINISTDNTIQDQYGKNELGLTKQLHAELQQTDPQAL